MAEREAPFASPGGTGPTSEGGPLGAPTQGPARHDVPQVSQWAEDLTERVVGTVGWLKSRTTVPVVEALRAIVYGFAAVVALLAAAVLGLIGVVRIWDVYLPVHPLARRVWLGYVVLGGVLFLSGTMLLAWRRSEGHKS